MKNFLNSNFYAHNVFTQNTIAHLTERHKEDINFLIDFNYFLKTRTSLR